MTNHFPQLDTIARKRDADSSQGEGARPLYEGLDGRGCAFLRPARTIGELPTPAARLAALEEAAPVIADLLGVPARRAIRFGEPIGLAYMTCGEIHVHPDGELLRRLGDDLPLDFCPSYGARPRAAAADARTWAASPYRLALMQRALARSDAELHGFRWRYEETARRIAAAIIGASC